MKKTKTGMPYFIFDNTVNTETDLILSAYGIDLLLGRQNMPILVKYLEVY